MRLALTLAVTVISIGLLGCAADPHKLKITEQNKDSYMESLKDSKGLTVEEIGLLMSAQMRRAAAKSVGGSDTPVVGKTVGEIIADEKKAQAEVKVREEEQKRLAAEAKAKTDALTEQMRNAIALTVFSKGFIPSDPMGGRYEDRITIKCAYENKSGKDIRAFTGRVEFTDLFGKEIFATNLTISDPIAAGAKGTWTGGIKYNQFISEHQNLKDADLADMKVVWSPSQVLFADGATLSAEPK